MAASFVPFWLGAPFSHNFISMGFCADSKVAVNKKAVNKKDVFIGYAKWLFRRCLNISL